jgi:hypothetical protein
MKGCAFVLAVSHRPHTVEVQVPFQVSPRGMRGGQSGNRTGSSQGTLVLLSMSLHHCRILIALSVANGRES